MTEKTFNTILVGLVITSIGLFIHKNYISKPDTQTNISTIEKVDNWNGFLNEGTSTNPTAQVQIVVFTDYECPFCKNFHNILQELKTEREFGLTTLHFPLPNHKFANITANMVECAKGYEKFYEMNDLLYAKQDSFGIKPWNSYATEINIDSIPWRECVDNNLGRLIIERNKVFGTKQGVHATPTVIINEWRIDGITSYKQLSKMIDNILQGKNPITGTNK